MTYGKFHPVGFYVRSHDANNAMRIINTSRRIIIHVAWSQDTRCTKVVDESAPMKIIESYDLSLKCQIAKLARPIVYYTLTYTSNESNAVYARWRLQHAAACHEINSYEGKYRKRVSPTLAFFFFTIGKILPLSTWNICPSEVAASPSLIRKLQKKLEVDKSRFVEQQYASSQLDVTSLWYSFCSQCSGQSSVCVG